MKILHIQKLMRWVASSALSESFANEPSEEKKNYVAGGRASRAN